MWKDFFYFSKSQRIGIIVLLVLIVIVLVANYTLPIFFPTTNEPESSFLTEVDSFKKSLVSIDSLKKVEWKRQYEERYQKYQPFPSFQKNNDYSLFPFDPNTVDSTTFVKLGLKPFIASNILKYRKKGGLFRGSADFGKVYGISPEKFKELEPYISIKDKHLLKNDSLANNTNDQKKNVIVDLNSADTTLLMQIKGIGRGYAKGIIRFRSETGGFVSVDQLNEIYGMRPENFERIRPYCRVNLNLIQKIKVNTASVERLRRHPYLSFYQAKAIYELRRNRGKLNNIDDLKELSEFTSESLTRIQPYLSFE
ncbi:MAG: helix-hairpin-helix domain-containing protein [Paludibacter sp.]|jgi:DNA uptake protein ComE-like DNA-binding protein|nr:helix-hairpin-helix domain-containing protein [Paludibacter sp.]